MCGENLLRNGMLKTVFSTKTMLVLTLFLARNHLIVEISGFHGSEYKDDNLLPGRYTM
jgi:hypothetical protein